MCWGSLHIRFRQARRKSLWFIRPGSPLPFILRSSIISLRLVCRFQGGFPDLALLPFPCHICLPVSDLVPVKPNPHVPCYPAYTSVTICYKRSKTKYNTNPLSPFLSLFCLNLSFPSLQSSICIPPPSSSFCAPSFILFSHPSIHPPLLNPSLSFCPYIFLSSNFLPDPLFFLPLWFFISSPPFA